MAALRCSGCRIDWPNDGGVYQPCPVCRKRTMWMISVKPISQSEARHIHFDAYYAERNERLMGEQEAELAELPQIASD